jgi:hypothetical protein
VSSDGAVALESLPFPFVVVFLLPILDVMSRFTRIHFGVEERGGGAAHRDMGVRGGVVAQFLDLDLEMVAVLE